MMQSTKNGTASMTEQLPENGLDMEEDDLEEALEEAALDDDDEELP